MTTVTNRSREVCISRTKPSQQAVQTPPKQPTPRSLTFSAAC